MNMKVVNLVTLPVVNAMLVCNTILSFVSV